MFLVISASPNTDGLTATCAKAALAGFAEAGAEGQHIDLCKGNFAHCRQCGNGWGTCRSEQQCVIDDDLQALRQQLTAAEGVVIVTPVYYGELSESAKAVFDRVRRCESHQGDNGVLVKKPVIAVAAAGGSGGGITTCLLSMERLIQHTRGQVADLIGVTQRNRTYQVETIRAAAAAMAKR
ncbi:MAG: flavodoxin family protein [Armatimonadota bacterium]